MQLTIKKLVLWPKDSEKSVREIAFDRGMVNVITGDSRSGKSALTAIIDYCLASGKCAIPVGEIRAKTGWFGLLLEIGEGQILVAREEPGDRQASSYCFWKEGGNLEVPPRVVSNTGVEEVKGRLNNLAKLSDLPVVSQEERGYRVERPSFRDMIAFNFLPQYIVANPYALFYKADRPDHREKLRAVFPLVLGIDQSETLALRQEKRELERQLRPLELDLEQRARAQARRAGDISGFWLRAQELGLLVSEEQTPPTLERKIAELTMIASQPEVPLPRIGLTEQAAESGAGLRAAEIEIASKIEDQKRRLGRLISLGGAAEDYQMTLRRQMGRLGGVGWLERKIRAKNGCPLCGSETDSAIKTMERLGRLASELSKETRAVVQTPPVVDKERSELTEEIVQLEEQRRRIRRERMQARGIARVPNESGGVTLEDVYRFLGGLEKALETFAIDEDEEDVRRKMGELNVRLGEISRRLDNQARIQREKASLSKVSDLLGDYAQFLRLERSDEPIELSIKDLNLVFSGGKPSRRDLLSELGSGENWMGYHLATFLALHEYLATLPNSPVAKFLVIDQPSQVYFPAQILDEHAEGNRPVLNDKDKEATRRIFEALANGVSRIGHSFQVIVTEHADSDIWGGIPGVTLAARWRGEGNYLIPGDWLS